MAEHPSFEGTPPGEPVPGKTYRADGWAYIVPLYVLKPDRDQLLMVIGEEHYHMIKETAIVFAGEAAVCIQFLMSPQGIENLIAYQNRKMQ